MDSRISCAIRSDENVSFSSFKADKARDSDIEALVKASKCRELVIMISFSMFCPAVEIFFNKDKREVNPDLVLVEKGIEGKDTVKLSCIAGLGSKSNLFNKTIIFFEEWVEANFSNSNN